MLEIEADEFARKYLRDELDEAQLLDVREPEEWDDYHIERATLIPVNTLPDNVSRLDPNKLTYVYCAHGVRSRYAVNYLLHEGFKRLVNVKGGLATVFHYLEQEKAETD